MDNHKWDRRFLRLIKNEIATWSKDESTQVGSLIVDENRIPDGWGYNGMPRGVDDAVPARHERPEKYFWMEHAERNAIDNSKGDLHGSTIYVTHHPCSGCARAIIQNGIARVVVDKENGINGELAQREKEDHRASQEMLDEVGIETVEIYIEE